jgi:pyridoxine/pyridoxamine 5'-phosphate oxidase
MATLTDAELLAYMRGHTLAVVSTIGPDGGPQAALVGVAVSDDLGIVFDTVTTSRKHANLLRDARASVTFSGPGEQTLQYQGAALPVSTTSQADAAWRELYYRAWPECRDHLAWPTLAYWRLEARWLRFSDYDRGPLTFERRF